MDLYHDGKISTECHIPFVAPPNAAETGVNGEIPHHRTMGDAFESNGFVLIASEKRYGYFFLRCCMYTSHSITSLAVDPGHINGNMVII